MRDHLTAADRLAPIDDKRTRALAYLRQRGIYALDQPVRKVPQRETLTLLDRWVRGKR